LLPLIKQNVLAEEMRKANKAKGGIGMQRLRNEKGFTMVELAVVVLILGILGLLGMRFYKGQVYMNKIESTAALAEAWAKAMREWKTQRNADDFQFLAALTGDDQRKAAFGYYAFDLGDEKNPWGRDSTGAYYTITLTTSAGCGGVLTNGTHNCGNLQIAVQTAAAAAEVASKINERLGIIDAGTGKGKTAATTADVELTDPMTNETYYKEMFAVATAGSNIVNVYAP
jgi:prepilin-type N-terminal cleavage/methylation domain-containing protein